MADVRQTTTILDDFNRANQAPVSGDWATAGFAVNGLDLKDNNLTGHAGGGANSYHSYYIPLSMDGNDAEIWAQPVGGNSPSIAFGIGLYSDPSSATADGYLYRSEVTTSGGTWKLYKLNNGVFTQVWTDSGAGPSLTGGEAGKMCLVRRNGNDVELWYDPVGDGYGNWDDFQLIKAYTDTSYVNNLHGALEIFGQSQINGWDNMGAGPLPVATWKPQIIRRSPRLNQIWLP